MGAGLVITISVLLLSLRAGGANEGTDYFVSQAAGATTITGPNFRCNPSLALKPPPSDLSVKLCVLFTPSKTTQS